MEFKCKECLLKLNLDSRVPRISPQCGHSYCVKCISRNLAENDGVFTCKVDQKSFRSQHGIQDFPINISLLSILKQQSPSSSYQQIKNTVQERDLKKIQDRVQSLIMGHRKMMVEEVQNRFKVQQDQLLRGKKKILDDLNDLYNQLYQKANVQISNFQKSARVPSFEHINRVQDKIILQVKEVTQQIRSKVRVHNFAVFYPIKLNSISLQKENQREKERWENESRHSRSIGRCTIAESKITHDHEKRPPTRTEQKSSFSSRGRLEKAEKIINHLQGNILELIGLGIRDEDLKSIFSMIQKSGKKIGTLKLVKNEIGDRGFKTICSKLRNNEMLHTLNLTSNQLTDDCFEPLQTLCSTNSILKNLYLTNNQLTKSKMQKKIFFEKRGMNLFL